MTGVSLIGVNKEIMDTTVEALIRDAWMKDIEPEDVTHVLNSEGIDLTLDQVRSYYIAMNQQTLEV